MADEIKTQEALDVLAKKKREIEEGCLAELDSVLKKWKCKLEIEMLIRQNQIIPISKVVAEQLNG